MFEPWSLHKIMQKKQDENMMRAALQEANLAKAKQEVPIGAVAVQDDKIIARAHNLRESSQDPFGHAETLLLRKLAQLKQSWRLEDVSIYVTCEPCLMCAGSLLQARIKRLVYGCKDPKAGACGSLYNLCADPRLNHQIELVSEILASDCSTLLSDFFKELRA